MRILIINDLFPPDVVGGYELRCQEAVEWLIQKDHDVIVLTTERDVKVESYDYHVYRILKKYPYGATPQEWGFLKRFCFAARDNYLVRRVVRKNKPNLIYLWHCAGISRALIPELFDLTIPTVVDVSDRWLYKVWSEWGPVYGFLTRTSSSLIKKYLKWYLLKILPIISFGLVRSSYSVTLNTVKGYFTSQWNKEFHVKHIAECHHFHVFHTGVNLKKFPYKQKTPINGTISLLYVGQISQEKGFLLLLDHLERLDHQRDLSITLTVVGDFRNEETKEIVLRRMRELNERCKVRLIGRVPHQDLYEYYHNSHFTVFPSIWDEPFSRVPLESMACGTPCISTDNPGSNELFNTDAPLLRLDRKDPTSLWKTIREYQNLPESYIQLSASGKEFIKKYYTFDRFMENVENLMFEQEMRKE
jgi:glycosyltransferase involved in cell wall biosynthesis